MINFQFVKGVRSQLPERPFGCFAQLLLTPQPSRGRIAVKFSGEGLWPG